MTRYGHATALLLYALLTVGLTWPVAARLGEVVPHDLGDPLLSTWTIWWNANVLPFTERWWDGRAFYPSKDTLTFSDHRVGVGLITTPAIWLGVSPLAAHNLAFLLSFFLSAGAAYTLGFTLTQSRMAAFLAGLVFGFNPFRAEHLPHLELLSSYWLPVVFLALHHWVKTLCRQWLIVLAISLVMLFLTSGYYFMFSGVLILLWLAWFIPRDLRLSQYGQLALAFALSLLAVTPVLLHYRRAHAALGLFRPLLEIEHYSADLSGLLSAPVMLALWNTPGSWHRPEGNLMPGATAVLLIAIALWVRRRPDESSAPRWLRRARTAVFAVGVVMATAAAVPTLVGPIAYNLGVIRISITDQHKPLSVATVMFGAWFLCSARVRQAWREQSALGFYTLATIVMWLFALGPTGYLFGHRVLYKAPYSWLMMLPGFGTGFRVPARFAMLAVMTLSIAAAVAFSRLTRDRSMRTQLAMGAIVALAITADSWIDPLPLPPPPSRLEIPSVVPADAAFLELPPDIAEDATAMYRSIEHRRPTVNGMSGHDAPHYTVLRFSLQEGRFEALKGYGGYGPIAIFLERNERGARMLPLVVQRAGATPIATTSTHEILLLPRTRLVARQLDLSRTVVPIHTMTASAAPELVSLMIDGDMGTAWLPPTAQDGTEQITLDLGQRSEVGGVVLATTKTEFPREVTIELSLDHATWTPVWQGDATATAVATAIEDPRFLRMQFEFERTHTRYIRVRQTGQAPIPWVVFEAQVLARK